MERRVIVIAGPTASGKTAFAIKIAEKLGTEIISADSRQLYKNLNIGTAKPSAEELSEIKHHFIDLLEIDEDYNVGKFESHALEVIRKLHSENKIPVVVGGSGLYIKALVDGIFNEVDTDEEYRKELLRLKEEKGNEYLYELLRRSDPVAAAELLPQNWKRIIRALEVLKISGKSIKEFHKSYKREDDLRFFQFALNWDREILYKRIEKRVDIMISQGLVEEVKEVLKAGYRKEQNAMNTVGYKEIISYLEGEISLERAVELIKRNTRRYAKRQMTWFRRDKRIKWFDISSSATPDISRFIEIVFADLGV